MKGMWRGRGQLNWASLVAGLGQAATGSVSLGSVAASRLPCSEQGYGLTA